MSIPGICISRVPPSMTPSTLGRPSSTTTDAPISKASMLLTVSAQGPRATTFRSMFGGSISTRPGAQPIANPCRSYLPRVDSTPLVAPEPVPTTNVFRLINANLAVSVANNEFSVGKADDWWGPTQTGSMAMSNNMEPNYALRINRVVPFAHSAGLRPPRAVSL